MAETNTPQAQAAQGSNPPAATSGSASTSSAAVADSATKSDEQAQAQNSRAVAGPAVEINHGEKPGWLKRREEAVKEALKDPYGTTPIQMRDDHDKYVDPQTDDAYPAQVLAPSGIAPEISNDAVADEFKVQGTLPPV